MKLKILLLSLFLLWAVNCTTYEYSIKNYNIPVSFSGENVPDSEKGKEFRIEKKLTWVLFDLVNVQSFDLSETLQEKFPKAKKIYNLNIHSEESVSDSIIRLFGTGMQIWALVTNRPLISRRTVIITGEVIEDDP